jgi:hypothetical protein
MSPSLLRLGCHTSKATSQDIRAHIDLRLHASQRPSSKQSVAARPWPTGSPLSAVARLELQGHNWVPRPSHLSHTSSARSRATSLVTCGRLGKVMQSPLRCAWPTTPLSCCFEQTRYYPSFFFPAVWAVCRAEPVPSHSWLSFCLVLITCAL